MALRGDALIRELPYFARFAARLAAGRPLPAVAGVSLTDVCNLDCAHCWRKNQGRGHAPWGKVLAALERLHSMGARYLYLQGGEPFTWADGRRRLADVVEAARAEGFFHVSVCTNGTFPLDAAPDSFSVSLEGRRESHDAIRCGSYARVLANIEAARHRKVFLNTTFNRLNAGDLDHLAGLVRSSPSLYGLLVNFHIPYPGVEGLALGPEERAALARRAAALKREDYPILNTFAGLRALETNDWKRPLPISVVTDCESYFACCRARGQGEVCSRCGYGLWAEASRVLDWDVRAVWDALPRLLA